MSYVGYSLVRQAALYFRPSALLHGNTSPQKQQDQPPRQDNVPHLTTKTLQESLKDHIQGFDLAL